MTAAAAAPQPPPWPIVVGGLLVVALLMVALCGCASRRPLQGVNPHLAERPLRLLPGRVGTPSAGVVSPRPPPAQPSLQTDRQAPATSLPDGEIDDVEKECPGGMCDLPPPEPAFAGVSGDPRTRVEISDNEHRRSTARVVTYASLLSPWFCSWWVPGAIFGAFVVVGAFLAGRASR